MEGRQKLSSGTRAARRRGLQSSSPIPKYFLQRKSEHKAAPPCRAPVKLVACNPELINGAERSGGKSFPSFPAPLIQSLPDAFVLIMLIGKIFP